MMFAFSKMMALLDCGWSVPSAIGFVAGDLLEWFRGRRPKAFS
jgi:hypothetical protein